MQKLTFFAAFALVFGVISCTSSKVLLDKTSNFVPRQDPILHLVSINPNFNVPANLQTEINRKSPKLIENNRDNFDAMLKAAAKKKGVHLQIEGSKNTIESYDSNYFNYLAPLKRDILQVMQLQDFPDVNRNNDQNTKLVRIYSKGIDIATAHSHLAEKYGTPYFALQGISLLPEMEETTDNLLLATSNKTHAPIDLEHTEAVYYNIIVDVSLSQIVYREFRKIKINTSSEQLENLLTDSFGLFLK